MNFIQPSGMTNPLRDPAAAKGSNTRSQSLAAVREMQTLFAQKMRQCGGGAVVGGGGGPGPIPIVDLDKFREYMASIFPDCDVGRGQEVSDDDQSSDSESDA